mmetsp:Transcript_53296/g.95130  ORF Transcript_53296/g.95130 Transcript_53296/m.95130 type:complete len:142 (+) Transcript_53296:1182-1607(+)
MLKRIAPRQSTHACVPCTAHTHMQSYTDGFWTFNPPSSFFVVPMPLEHAPSCPLPGHPGPLPHCLPVLSPGLCSPQSLCHNLTDLRWKVQAQRQSVARLTHLAPRLLKNIDECRHVALKARDELCCMVLKEDQAGCIFHGL